MNRLFWYFYRLKRLPLPEFFYRAKLFVLKKFDKIFPGKKIPDSVPFPDYVGERDVSGSETYFPGLESRTKNYADLVLKHRFRIFGIERDFGDPIDWYLDPKTGKSWPGEFWGDIDYRNGKTTGGIKFAWELNRFHHFPCLAISYALTKNESYREEIFDQLAHWLEFNSYPNGINWIMGIELGIRIVNLIYTLKFLGPESLRPEHRQLIGRFVFTHAAHLYRYPSKYSSCANHAVAEALGLFLSGLCFPELKNAAKWKGFGKRVLEREIKRQIYPDGSNFEHSLPYLQFVLDHFLVYFLFCEEYGEDVDVDVENRLNSSFGFISAILDKKGNFPSVGDDDDGHLIKFWFGEHNNFISLLNTGAVLFNKPDWILENAEFDQKTFFLLGKDSAHKWHELKKSKKRDVLSVQSFDNAGLTALRDVSPFEILFVVNSGPLGLKPLGGHGHADALSFWLSIDGHPVFIDPGTYLYHSGGKWRRYFRSTSAHNTIRVDDLDQSEIVSDFMFKNFYDVNRTRPETTGEGIQWTASHDAYERLKDPVRHKRKFFYDPKEKKFVISDELTVGKKHRIACFFHLHPDCSAIKADNIIAISCGNQKVRLHVDRKWQLVELKKGEKSPIIGWYSPGFNEIKEAYAVVLSADITESESFVSIIDFES